MKTISFEETLTLLYCGECNIPHGIPDSLYRKAKSDGKSWYCPNGHSLVMTESKAKKLEKELERQKRHLTEEIRWLEEENMELQEDRDQAKKDAKVAKSKLTKTMNRIKNGVCPCCRRSFENLHEHMKSKHPELYESK